MAYDRYDTRDSQRDERSRWQDDNRSQERGWGRESRSERGGRDERGFFERAGDEIASWFGDEDAERRRRQEQSRDDPNRSRGFSQDRDRQKMSGGWNDRDEDRSREHHNRENSWFSSRGSNDRGGYAERDYNPSWRRELAGSFGRDHERDPGRRYGSDRDQDYRPMTGDYGRSERSYSARDNRSDSDWDRDQYRSTSRAGTQDQSDRSRHDDPHYHSWRDRHMSELDRDYHDFRREHQSRFEDEFASWRQTRQQKRGLLGQVREHMEVVGSDDEHIGTVDKVAGDRLILTKSDPEAGGSHHSLSCSDIDRIDGNRVIIGCKAEDARKRWRDESRSRALFEREDQGQMGPGVLDRSFSGTYR